MSITSAKAALAAVLAPMTTNYGSGTVTLKKVYTDPKEATSIGEFPAAIIALAPDITHVVRQETAGAFGLARHVYTLRVWLLVGTRQTPINELVRRCEAWVEPLIVAMMDNVTLNDSVSHVGDGVDTLLTYTEQPIQWGLTDNEPTYYGLRIDLPITELISTAVNP